MRSRKRTSPSLLSPQSRDNLTLFQSSPTSFHQEACTSYTLQSLLLRRKEAIMASHRPMQLTPEQARELNSRGATLLLLDVPVRTQLGFDYLTFTTADKFKGIKMLPPGPHLLHITPPPSTASHTASHSPDLPYHQWLYLHTAEILVRRFTPPATLLPVSARRRTSLPARCSTLRL